MSVIASQFVTNTSFIDITPLGVAPNGNIYVANGSFNVSVYSSTGTYITIISVPDYITQFTVDYTNNILYCAGPSYFFSINPTTNTVSSQYSNGLIGCAFSTDGYVYATSNSGYAIKKITPSTGASTTIFTSSGGNVTDSGGSTFAQCTFDTNQNLYCITKGTGKIYKFDRSGTLLELISTTGGSYGGTFGLTCDITTNILYATATGSPGAVFKIKNGTSTVYTTLTGSAYGSSYCIFYDKNTAKLYASNRPYYVVIINPEILDSYTVSPPSIPNYYPGTVTLYYSSMNSTVGKIYNLVNSLSTTVSTVTYTIPDISFNGITAPGAYSTCRLIAVGNGKLYLNSVVYPVSNPKVSVCDLSGNILSQFDVPGIFEGTILDLSNTRIYSSLTSYIDLSSSSVQIYIAPSTSYVHNGIAIGPDGYLYVLTEYNFNRINPITQTAVTTNPVDSSNNAFNFTSCTFGTDGYVYGISNGNIYKFTTAGAYVSKVASLPETTIGLCTCDTATNTIYAGTSKNCYKITSAGVVTVFRTTVNKFNGLYYDKTSNDLFLSEIGGADTGISTIYRCFVSSNTSSKPITFNFAGSYLSGGTTTLGIKDASGNSFGIPITITQVYPCFLQGSKILRLDPETDEESYVPVETLRRGDLIRTATCGYKAVAFIGRGTVQNPADDPDKKNRLYGFRDAKGDRKSVV